MNSTRSNADPYFPSATHPVAEKNKFGKNQWALSDIAFDDIRHERVRDDEVLFFVIAASSLIESGSDIYTSVLVDYFDDEEISGWLSQQWEHEELQHGLALRLYVEEVWPEIDWETMYRNFVAEYSGYCSAGNLEQSPVLELVARCVVETGTATLYRALEDYVTEPVLKQIVGNIRRDEVRHYKNFNRFFHRQNLAGGHGRWSIFKALARRLAELRNEDSDCALRHVFAQRYPGGSVASEQFQTISRDARALVMRNATPDMMVKMLMQPLRLPGYMRSAVEKPCSQMMRLFMVG